MSSNVSRSANYGISWNSISSPMSSDNWYGVTMSSSGKYALLCGDNRTIYASQVYGQAGTWYAIGDPGSKNWRAIKLSDGGLSANETADGIIATAVNLNGEIYSGLLFNQLRTVNSNSKNWKSIAASSDGTTLCAVTYGEYIYKSTDSGETWTSLPEYGLQNWRSVSWCNYGNQFIAVSENGLITPLIDSNTQGFNVNGINLTEIFQEKT